MAGSDREDASREDQNVILGVQVARVQPRGKVRSKENKLLEDPACPARLHVSTVDVQQADAWCPQGHGAGRRAVAKPTPVREAISRSRSGVAP
jgi:hypothetical protein